MTRRLRPVLALLMWSVLARPAAAAHGDYAEAMRVRALIVAEKQAPEAAETIRLPVSRGFDQGSTQLCWAYATLNALESNYRAAHPGSALELSRRTMQFLTMEDRWLRKIRQTEDYITERGVAVDALRLVVDNGLVAYSDYTDIDDPYGDDGVGAAVDDAHGEPAKIAALEDALATLYGVPPATTHLDATELTRDALQAAVLAGGDWESYAIARDGEEGYRTHPDPDARAGARSWFMPLAKVVARVHDALKSGHAVEITIGGHCILIYGAAYDAGGNPLTYFIKDSYPGYFYEADPARTMQNLIEMTAVKPAAPGP